MATIQTIPVSAMNAQALPRPANNDEPLGVSPADIKIISWLFRATARVGSRKDPFLENSASPQTREQNDDWQTVTSLCGYTEDEFTSSGIDLPLTAAEIDHFRRNHREADMRICRDFLATRLDIPSPLAELYGLYRHRAQRDTEATLFVAQATGSTRIARVMADLLAIGGFANGHECLSHLTLTYSVAAAFDTSDLIDRANSEAARRLALSIEHPSHLLKLSPDEISLLATNIVEKNALSAPNFLEKANLLAEARQDVGRLPRNKQFMTAIAERDLPSQALWVARLCSAYARIFGDGMAGLPEIQAIMGNGAEIRQLF